MPRGKKKSKEQENQTNEVGPSKSRECTEQQQKSSQTSTDEDQDENTQNQDELQFLSNDQVLWFRNIIRAQGKDILKEMVEDKWAKVREENEMLKQWVKSETGILLKKVKELEDDNREKQRTIEQLTTDCQKKQRRLERIEHECSQKDNQIKTLRLELDDLQQQKHDHSLQVVGLPEVESNADDIKQIIKLSKDKLHIKLKSSDFEVIRLGKKRELATRNTLLKFKEKSLRDKIFEQRKKTVTYANPGKNIYFNDQLTKHRQNLLFAARKLVKSKKLFAAWAQQGNILIRKTESDKIIQVHDHCDLKVITSDEESIEMLRGNGSQTQTSDERLSIITHISNYEYYIDSDV